MAEKKQPSPAQLAAREKFAQAARERAAKRKAEKEQPQGDMPGVNVPTPSQPDTNDVEKLWAYIKELEQKAFFPQAQQPVAPVRAITKYSVAAGDYPDPRQRLFAEQRLILKNFVPQWWALEWKVDKVFYDKDGVKYTEPRFTLELWHIMENEAGEPSDKRYKVCSGMFFEDPDSFMTVAEEKGLEVPPSLQKEFMDEMRYMIIRDWLFECFYPPKPTTQQTNRTETVIGNRLVEVVEINSETAVNAFSHLTPKA